MWDEGSRKGREGGRKEKTGIKGKMICPQMGRLVIIKTSVLPKLIRTFNKVISKSIGLFIKLDDNVHLEEKTRKKSLSIDRNKERRQGACPSRYESKLHVLNN